MPTLARVNVTPVKGLALQHPAVARITEAGLPENRRFYLVDESGRLFSGSNFGRVGPVRPGVRATAESLTLTFPDGTRGHRRRGTLGAAESTDYYGRSVPPASSRARGRRRSPRTPDGRRACCDATATATASTSSR